MFHSRAVGRIKSNFGSPLPADIASASLELSRYNAEGLYEPEMDAHGDEVEVNLLEYWEVCKRF